MSHNFLRELNRNATTYSSLGRLATGNHINEENILENVLMGICND